MIYSDIIEHNIVGDTKTTLLRCIPFSFTVKIGDIISTGQYMNYLFQIYSLKSFWKTLSIVSRSN